VDNYSDTPGGNISGYIYSFIDGLPDGRIAQEFTSDLWENTELDTCEEDVLRWIGGTGVYSHIRPTAVAGINYASILLVASGDTGGDRVVYTASQGNQFWAIRWNPDAGTISFRQGSDSVSDSLINFSVAGPGGATLETYSWIAVEVQRLTNKVVMRSRYPDGAGGVLEDTVEHFNMDSSVLIKDSIYYDVFPSGGTALSIGSSTGGSGYAGFVGKMFWTGITQSLFSIETLIDFDLQFRRNLKGYIPPGTEEGEPPDGSLIKYNATTKLWEFVPHYPLGGNAGDQFVKLSDGDFDVGWRQRDVKTHFSTDEPSETDVLEGDFWIPQ
jgi:hypothetical protein